MGNETESQHPDGGNDKFDALIDAIRAKKSSFEVIRALMQAMIEYGAVEAVCKKIDFNYVGMNVLMYAIFNNSPIEIIYALIAFGGKEAVCQTNIEGQNALMWAFRSNNKSLDVIQTLIDYGGKETVCQTDNSGWNALMWAFQSYNRPSLEV